jgi:hypothetical protein
MRVSLLGLPAAAVCLAALTAACSGGNPADGTLTGHMYGDGGPVTSARVAPSPWPGTVVLVGPGVHRDVSVAAGGSYSVTVPPGRYTVTGFSPRYGGGICRAAGTVRVIGGQSARADVLCQMK